MANCREKPMFFSSQVFHHIMRNTNNEAFAKFQQKSPLPQENNYVHIVWKQAKKECKCSNSIPDEVFLQ